MRGTVSGVVWGLVLGGAGLSIASLVNDQIVAANQPAMPQVTTPQTADVPLDPTPENLTTPADDPTPAISAQAPSVMDPASLEAETAPDKELSTVPQAVVADPIEPAPIENIEAAPLTPPVVVETPDADQASPDTAPTNDIAEAPDAVALDTSSEIELVTPEAAAQPVVVIEPPATPSAESIEAPTTAPAETSAVVDDAPARPVPTAEQPEPPATPDDAADLEPEPSIAQAPQVPTLDEDEAISALPRVNTGVRVNRPGETDAETVGTPADIIEAPENDADAPALERFAAPFENPQGWPVVSVVLLDDGTLDNAASVLAALPVPVTVILDPLKPDAGAAMTSYRSADIEVGLQVALPLGARAQDVEVAFEAALKLLPEAVVLFSSEVDLVQSERGITEQVAQVLAAKGLGLIAVERGLSNVQRVAARAGVPAAFVQRVLDADNSGAINRALDQAAFRARQGDGVVLQGPLTTDLLNALSDWAKDASANQVAVAPASAVLLSR